MEANQAAKLRFKFSKRSLRKLKAAMERGKHPKAKIAVPATDGVGNTCPPLSKTVKLKD